MDVSRFEIDPPFAATLRSVGGDDFDRVWPYQMEELVTDLEVLWSADLTTKFHAGPASYLLSGRAPSQQLVLKLFASADAGLDEAAGYAYWASSEAFPRLYDLDEVTGSLLLERVPAPPSAPTLPLEYPTTMLAELHSAPFSRRPGVLPAHRHLISRIPPLGVLLSRMADHVRHHRSPRALAAALRKGVELASSYRGPRFVLHGAFLPEHLLVQGQHAWVVDPSPALGDPAFDAGSWVAAANYPRKLTARVLSDSLELEVDRVLAWAEVLSVLRPPAPAETTGLVGAAASAL